jgi:NTE family protein
VSAALADVEEIKANRGDYTEAGFQRALAAANAALQKAKQSLATCERMNAGSAQQVVVPIPDAVLASAAIPFVFEPVKLGIDTYVDGGVRQSVPIGGAIAAGATNVWAVLAGHIAVSPEPVQDPLTGGTITTYGGASFVQIAERAAMEIMPAQIEQDNINLLAAWSAATVTIIQPELGTSPPDIHNGFTVDPGLIRIRMAHGYMRTDDVNTARELRGNGWASVADQISQLLFTTDIVNLRYQIWLREHDYHAFAPNFTRHGTLQQPTPVVETEAALVLADIRQMKQKLEQLVQQRLMGINLDGTPIVLDRPLQGAVPDQPTRMTDWWLEWEAHQFATPGAPWDAKTPFTPLPLPVATPLIEFSTTSTLSTSGVVDQYEVVEIRELTRGTQIYYTLDGTDPTRSSDQYEAAVALAHGAVVKARAFAPDGQVSLVAKATAP